MLCRYCCVDLDFEGGSDGFLLCVEVFVVNFTIVKVERLRAVLRYAEQDIIFGMDPG